MAHDINMYGIVQKDQMGLDKAVEETKFRMSRYSVTPNVRVRSLKLCPYACRGAACTTRLWFLRWSSYIVTFSMMLKWACPKRPS